MRLTLSGDDWQLKGYIGEDWRIRNAHKWDTRDTRHWFKGYVPGSVHNDLWMQGEIPNPYFERNSLLLEWIPARTWVYKKTFFVTEDLRDKRVQLCFEGVDYEAEFFLNGESLGTHRGMYTPVNFDINTQLRYGEENLLAVVIEPSPQEQPQVGRTNKVRTHKSRMTYWWDFCPRMIHIGIWDEVYLNVTEVVRVDDVFVRPQLEADFRSAKILVSTELNIAHEQVVEVEIRLLNGSEGIASSRIQHHLTTGKINLTTNLSIDRPRLWWPNGHGEQALYQAEINIRAHSDQMLDSRTVSFGIRKIELIQNEGCDPTALPYTFVVNGRKLFIKGWNWVPIDVMYGVPRQDKLHHLLDLAEHAHVNMLRVWGGGLIETETFYNRCDQLGIMVWQEFIQSSSGVNNNPPEPSDYIEMMIQEAEQIIPRKRNHSSLVLWGGGNELSSETGEPQTNSHPLLAALKAVVTRLDPDRHWLPTSPSGRVFMNSLDNITRDPLGLQDVHGPWEYQGVTKQYELYNRSTSLLHSEFGVEGITNRKTLNETLSPEHQWPATLDNIYWHHLGAWWVHQPKWQETFGAPKDIESLIHITQFVQAEGLRYAIEADRRRKYQNSGTLPWQFNEPYPMTACTSAIDYYGIPKPAYYAVVHAYEPLHISARFDTIAWANQPTFEAQIWVNNSHETVYSDATLDVQLIGLAGNNYLYNTYSVNFSSNRASFLKEIQFAFDELEEEIFFLDLHLTDRNKNILSHNRYLFTRTSNLAPLLTLPSTELSIHKTLQGNNWILDISNTGNYSALGIWLENSRALGKSGYTYFNNNHFTLLPGETRSVSVTWQDVPPIEQQLTISGWNTNQWSS